MSFITWIDSFRAVSDKKVLVKGYPSCLLDDGDADFFRCTRKYGRLKDYDNSLNKYFADGGGGTLDVR